MTNVPPSTNPKFPFTATGDQEIQTRKPKNYSRRDLILTTYHFARGPVAETMDCAVNPAVMLVHF